MNSSQAIISSISLLALVLVSVVVVVCNVEGEAP